MVAREPSKPLISSQVQVRGTMLERFLWLYGLYTVLNNVFYLIGFYLLPEGFMRGSPAVTAGRLAAAPESFWGELALTLLFNLGLTAGLGVVCNLSQVRGLPAGYVVPIFLGITSGLISGTNSFAASDLKAFNAWEGTALGISIGGLEMMAYCLIIAATVRLGIYQYRSWRDLKGTKVMRLRDVRFTRDEIAGLVVAIGLLIFAAVRETLLALNP